MSGKSNSLRAAPGVFHYFRAQLFRSFQLKRYSNRNCEIIPACSVESTTAIQKSLAESAVMHSFGHYSKHCHGSFLLGISFCYIDSRPARNNLIRLSSIHTRSWTTCVPLPFLLCKSS